MRGVRMAWAMMAALTACDAEPPSLRKVPATGFFDPPQIDFGVRNVGLTYELRVGLTNTSAQTIQVQEVRFDPETDAFLPRLAAGGTFRGTRLSPGQNVALLMRYAPRSVGDNDVVMTVVFADFEIDVPILATARQLEPARPLPRPRTVTFVDVPVNGQASQVVELFNSGETDGALASMSFLPPFSVRAVGGAPLVVPTDAVSPGQALRVEVVYSPFTLDPAAGTIVFEFDSRERSAVEVQGRAAPAGVMTCQPSALDLGDVPRGQVVEERVDCQATGGPYELVQVLFAEGSSPSFRLARPPTGVDAQGRVSIDLEFVSDSLPRMHRAVVELVAAHGAVTPIEAVARTVSPDPASTGIAIDLAWNSARTDFDLHLVRSEGLFFSLRDDCYWQAKNPNWGDADERLDDPFLDRDDTDGFGPEVLNLALPAERRYDVYVQYFGYDGPSAPATTAEVEIALEGSDPIRVQRVMDECGLTWHLGRIEVTDGVGRFFSQDTVTDQFRGFARDECQ